MRAGPPPPLRLARLTADHETASFECGDDAVDDFLRSRARAEQGVGLSRTTVAVHTSRGVTRVVGYFTLSPLSVRLDTRLLASLELERVIPYPVVGGYLLGRLGIATDCAGQGLGGSLVAVARQHALRARNHTGGVFLAVDAKTPRLVRWYESLGFARIGEGMRLVAKL